MQINRFAVLGVLASFLTACGGDLNIDGGGSTFTPPSDTPVSNSPSGPCAFYFDANGDLQQGDFNGADCNYDAAFVDFNNPILGDLTIADTIVGAHIFSGSIFVGESFDTLAETEAAGIMRGGDGPTLTIEPGVTIAIETPQDFIAINRGSQIIAQGTADAPITFTSEVDVRGLTTAEQVGTWGGMVIAGFGFLNGCEYLPGFDFTDPNSELVLPEGSACSDLLEGTEGGTSVRYGGTVPDDSSGILEFVVVKHAGFAIDNDNELNGITFGAVGSGTQLSNVEIYSNLDDGIEFFGGGADLDFYLGMYIRDDSIDIDQGYYGTITNALVIQAGGGLDEADPTGAHCVESDGSSSGEILDVNFANGYVSQATINNLTCIISAKGPGVAGNNDAGAGINAEESHFLTLNRSIVTTAYAVDASIDATGSDDSPIPAAQLPFINYCLQLEDDEDLENAANGLININTTIFACADLAANGSEDGDILLPMGAAFPAGTTGTEFLAAQDNVLFMTADDGTTPPDSAGGLGEVGILDSFYSVPLADMMIDGTPVSFTDTTATVIGAVTRDNDWTQGWTFGLNEGARDQELWFELP